LTNFLTYALTNSVAGPPATDVVESRGCCVNRKQTLVFNQEDKVLIIVL